METDLRFQTLAWNKGEDSSLRPPTSVKYVDFYEYNDVQLGKTWGYWVIDNADDDAWVGATAWETRRDQLRLTTCNICPLIAIAICHLGIRKT